MTQQQSRKFEHYKTMVTHLQRKGLAHPGKLTSVLLKGFAYNKGYFYAGDFEFEGLCQPGQFKIYRDTLCSLGIIIYDYDRVGNFAFHEPGKEIVKYVGAEILSKELPATRKEVQKLEQALKRIINKLDPPYSDDKLEQYLNEKL